MTRWIIRFGYDGRGFLGWARQPGKRTIEGEILRGLRAMGVASADGLGSIAVASRTDRGVSARGNALVLPSDLSGEDLLRALNGISPEIYFTHATEVPDTFRPRECLGRTYRYFDPLVVHHSEERRAAVHALEGRIDARSFGRAVPADQPCWRTIESVTSHTLRGGNLIEVRAPAFVWGMVRKIVAALREIDAGRLSVPSLRAAATGRVRLTLPLAEPEPLVLWDVHYPLKWEHAWSGLNRHQSKHWTAARTSRWVHARLIDALAPKGPVPHVGS